jgi:hypothetical protein
MQGEGRVAQLFGFALTAPYVRLSRIRRFPKVTPNPKHGLGRVSEEIGLFGLYPAMSFHGSVT